MSGVIRRGFSVPDKYKFLDVDLSVARSDTSLNEEGVVIQLLEAGGTSWSFKLVFVDNTEGEVISRNEFRDQISPLYVKFADILFTNLVRTSNPRFLILQ